MDFISIFKFLSREFSREKIEWALIGGWALQAAGIPRTTMDIDLMITQADKDRVKALMITHGYEIVHESEDVLNFVSSKFELGRVDFLLAHRRYALAMLKNAAEKDILSGRLKIRAIGVEDQIGLKLQACANNPKRFNRDMADIKMLLDRHWGKLNLVILKEYFALFGRQKDLESIMEEIREAHP